MRNLLYLLLIASAPLQGQVKMIIEDQAQRGFYLGVNHFLQHPEKQEQLVIENLDTIPYLIHIETDSFNFSKSVHLRHPGVYRFLLLKNSRGELKLRYRGEGTVGPELTVIPYRQEVPWPSSWQPKVAASTLALRKARLKNQHTPRPAKDSITVAIVPADSIDQKAGVLRPDNDTVQQQMVVVATPKKVQEPYPALLEAMSQADFEFERLKLSLEYTATNSLLTEEARGIMLSFQYDHSRLEFIQKSLPAIRDPQHLMKLEEEFEYILSREKFKKMLVDEQ